MVVRILGVVVAGAVGFAAGFAAGVGAGAVGFAAGFAAGLLAGRTSAMFARISFTKERESPILGDEPRRAGPLAAILPLAVKGCPIRGIFAPEYTVLAFHSAGTFTLSLGLGAFGKVLGAGLAAGLRIAEMVPALGFPLAEVIILALNSLGTLTPGFLVAMIINLG